MGVDKMYLYVRDRYRADRVVWSWGCAIIRPTRWAIRDTGVGRVVRRTISFHNLRGSPPLQYTCVATILPTHHIGTSAVMQSQMQVLDKPIGTPSRQLILSVIELLEHLCQSHCVPCHLREVLNQHSMHWSGLTHCRSPFPRVHGLTDHSTIHRQWQGMPGKWHHPRTDRTCGRLARGRSRPASRVGSSHK